MLISDTPVVVAWGTDSVNLTELVKAEILNPFCSSALCHVYTVKSRQVSKGHQIRFCHARKMEQVQACAHRSTHSQLLTNSLKIDKGCVLYRKLSLLHREHAVESHAFFFPTSIWHLITVHFFIFYSCIETALYEVPNHAFEVLLVLFHCACKQQSHQYLRQPEMQKQCMENE